MTAQVQKRRRWLQMSLSSLFVVTTLIALWLGWELNFIRARQAWLREHPGLADLPSPPGIVKPSRLVVHGNLELSADDKLPFSFPSQQPDDENIPWWRSWLGDRAVKAILDNDFTDEERAHVASLFAEAEIRSVRFPKAKLTFE